MISSPPKQRGEQCTVQYNILSFLFYIDRVGILVSCFTDTMYILLFCSVFASRLEAIRGDFYGAGAGGGAGLGEEVEGPDASLEDIVGGTIDTAPPPEGEGIGSEGVGGVGEESPMDGNAYEAEYAYRAPPGRTRGGQGAGYGAGAAYYAAAGGGGGVNQSEYVLVDAHVLASPVLADINGDGHMEVR